MTRTALALSVAVAASITAAASADILLTVDITNPTAVVISSTGGLSSVTTGEQSRQIALLGALAASAPVSNGNFLNGNLTASNGRTYSAAFQSDGYLLIGGSNQFQAFTQGQQAFFGSSTINLSFPQFVGFAPVGTVGDIVIWDSFTPVIGQYQIIPAPGAAAALAIGGLLATRRRR